MKKYKVSLGIIVLANYEIEVGARSEAKAIEIAERDFEHKIEWGNPGEFTEPDWDEVERMGENSIYVEEIVSE